MEPHSCWEHIHEDCAAVLLRRLIDAYDRLNDDDPRGRAVEFESALAEARAALDA